MAAGSIVIDLLMKTGAFETDTKRAEKRLKEFEKSAKQWGVSVAAAATAAATAFGFLAKKSIDNLDALDEMSQSLGLAVEQLSSIGNVARVEGMNLDDFGSSMVKLTKIIAEAKSGSEEASAVFAALGLDPNSFRDSEDALLSVAEVISGYRDGLEKTALSQELFGKSGYKMIAFLNQGKDGINAVRMELDSFGLTSTEAARQAGEFNDTITKINIIFDKMVEKIVTLVLPTLKSLTEGFLEAVKASNSFSMAGLATLETKIFGGASDPQSYQAKLIEEIQKTEEILKSSDVKFRSIVEAGLAYKKAELALVNQQLNAMFGGSPETIGFLGTPDKPAAPSIMKSAGAAKESEYQKAIQNINEQIALLGKETEAEKTLANIQLGKFGKLNEEQKLNLVYAAESLDMLKQSKTAWEEYSKFISDVTGRGDADKFVEQMSMLATAFYEGAINAEQYQTKLDELVNKLKQNTDEMGEFAKEAARNIQDALGDTLEQVLTGNFKNIGDSFVKMLQRMTAQLASSQLNKLLFGNFDKSGDIGGIIGSIGKAIGGAFAGTTATPELNDFFAAGGYTGHGGKLEPAGVVHRGEYVINADATKKIGTGFLDKLNKGYANGGYVGNAPTALGGNVNINIKNEASADGYQASASAKRNETGIDIDVVVKRAVAADLRNNGGLAQQFASTFGLRRTA